jgi:glycosyltransferase involved in cell wall biosynthesis
VNDLCPLEETGQRTGSLRDLSGTTGVHRDAPHAQPGVPERAGAVVLVRGHQVHHVHVVTQRGDGVQVLDDEGARPGSASRREPRRDSDYSHTTTLAALPAAACAEGQAIGSGRRHAVGYREGMSDEPVVLHFNDCAFVARTLVRAARRQALDWRYMPPREVRPARPPGGRLGRLRYVPYLARRAAALRSTDVVHVHYATSVRLIRERLMPLRPYFLHLHGTDIREQSRDPLYREEITRAILGAERVYFTNLDTAGQARALRPDAEYMPAFVDLAPLPPWQPGAGAASVVFASRWSRDKGADAMLRVAVDLRRSLPAGTRLLGLDWGEKVPAARAAGVEIVSRRDHEGYLRLLAGASVVVGQATQLLGVSELEAMAIGVPVVVPGAVLPHPDGGAPPVLCGSDDEVVEHVHAALTDPMTAACRLDARRWVSEHYTPDPFVAPLQEAYRAAAR